MKKQNSRVHKLKEEEEREGRWSESLLIHFKFHFLADSGLKKSATMKGDNKTETVHVWWNELSGKAQSRAAQGKSAEMKLNIYTKMFLL